MAVCRNPRGGENRCSQSIVSIRRVGLRGICFSFCQLEFPFQIPFWLYDQATAVFMGGHSLAGGADLVRENFYFFSLLKAVQEAAAFSKNVAEWV